MNINRSLFLFVAPLVKSGGQIQVTIRASNAPATHLKVHVPDTAVIEGPRECLVGSGDFEETLFWRVVHVQPGTRPLVEFQASAGPLHQTGLCKVVP